MARHHRQSDDVSKALKAADALEKAGDKKAAKGIRDAIRGRRKDDQAAAERTKRAAKHPPYKPNGPN